MKAINKVAVLGSGTMGSGIAGICANAGCEVLLLDLDASAGQAALERLSGGRSPVVTDPACLANIQVGSFEQDLGQVGSVDWICEAVVEDVDIKRALFQKVEVVRGDGSILTSNTSGITLSNLCAGMPDRLRRDIAVTHFFNPVHVMKLVELVPGQATRPDIIPTLADFLGNTLGKGVVYAKDTVNFIGNRIGCLWMLAGLHIAESFREQEGLDIPTIDALLSKPIGLPATGLYGLIDLIGLDILYHVGRNLEANLSANDPGQQFVRFPDNVQKLHDRGQLGRKTGGGFYRLIRHDDGSKSKEVFDLGQDTWQPCQEVDLPTEEQSLQGLYQTHSSHGRLVQRLMTETLCYSGNLLSVIADDIVNIDRAMRWGFGWQQGPFELIDALGASTVDRSASRIGMRPPAMLSSVLAQPDKTFYRSNGQEYFGIDGHWHEVE